MDFQILNSIKCRIGEKRKNINDTKSWFCEKINKNNSMLTRITMKKRRRTQITNTGNEIATEVETENGCESAHAWHTPHKARKRSNLWLKVTWRAKENRKLWVKVKTVIRRKLIAINLFAVKD